MKYLKQLKKLLPLSALAFMLTFLSNALTVSANEPTTYCLMFSEEDDNWRYQVRSQWDFDDTSTPIYYLDGNLKNGDIVVINDGSNTVPVTIKVHLSNLTFTNPSGTIAMVSVAGGVDHCYVNKGAVGSVTGAVTNAYVYGDALANFNNNVLNLYSYEVDTPDVGVVGPTIGVTGTVSYFESHDADGSRGYYGTNFKANTFFMDEGVLETDEEDYTQDVSGGPVTAAAQSASASQSTTSAASKSGTSSDEYDKVPKTGESSSALWLCLAAAVCLSGSLFLRRSER